MIMMYICVIPRNRTLVKSMGGQFVYNILCVSGQFFSTFGADREPLISAANARTYRKT